MVEMKIKIAKPSEFKNLRSFYHKVIDLMQDAEYKPAWEKGVYPSDAYLRESIMQHLIYTALQYNYSCAATPSVTEESNIGDVNEDGMITPTDAAKALSAYADEQTTGVSGLTEAQFKNSDVNTDSVITPTDAASYYAYISITTDADVLGIEEYLKQ